MIVSRRSNGRANALRVKVCGIEGKEIRTSWQERYEYLTDIVAEYNVQIEKPRIFADSVDQQGYIYFSNPRVFALIRG